ncbi:chaperonin 10-like protein [Gilbertella persicaria]|uniref:chaperonin 10-like protein n=1 Tax=Gilbertella persicaria TaxID=101096 RepID=UPI00222120F4|nr:chaperonin 10-like protein [Gilbertella persicaria]KAI8069066.1 chaperonin 10-like protein [Gilbertella persicaria]
MSAENDTFNAWAGVAKDQPLERVQLQLRQWTEDCVEMNITHCGICASDVHTLEEGEEWGSTNYPCVVGHEITGIVTRVGKNVTHLRVGDRAGVGAQCGSCHECDHCKSGNENLCFRNMVTTYNSKWENGDKTYGGYADKWRGDCRFAFKIPDHLSNEVAATFFCAGVTTYAPLKRANVNSESTVGIMGLGGLGHYGVLWAKAMGAKVVAISSGDHKREVAKELGCNDYINSRDPEDLKRYTKKFSHILCTGCSSDFEWSTYLALIRGNGYFLNVNAPRWKFPAISPFVLLMNQCFIHGSAIGSPAEIEDMLKFAEEKQIKPWLQKYSMKDVNKALEDFRAGKPRFRFVLEN